MANPFKSIEKKIKKGIESLGNEVMGKIRRVGSQVEDGIKSVGRKAESEVKDVAHHAESGIKSVAHDAEETLEKAAKDAKDDIEDFAEEVCEEAKEAATAAAQAALAEMAAGGLNKVVDACQVLIPSSISLSLGPFVLAIDDLTSRIDTLQRWASKPPSTRHEIRAIIEEIAPTSVSINISFSLAFLVVQTDSLEFGIESTYETADFLDKFDALLAHYGINI